MTFKLLVLGPRRSSRLDAVIFQKKALEALVAVSSPAVLCRGASQAGARVAQFSWTATQIRERVPQTLGISTWSFASQTKHIINLIRNSRKSHESEFDRTRDIAAFLTSREKLNFSSMDGN